MATKNPGLAERLKAHPDLLAKYMGNPGLRSKLPDSYLTPAQRKKRAMNARLNAPITPGSSVTGRDLSQEANAATALRYGPQERALTTQQAQTRQQGIDQAGWYDQYRAELQQHASNAGAINAAAVSQMQQTGAGLRGLDQTNAAQQQQALGADAASRGSTVDPRLATDAFNASLVRQQMLAGFTNQQASTGAANQTYADTNANVVAPAQKLRARAQSAADVRALGDKLVGVAADKGAYQQQYRAGAVSDEAKNVLAQQALNLDTKKADTQTALGVARLTETKRSNLATETAAQKRIRLEAERVQIAKDKKAATKKTKPAAGPGSLPAATEAKTVSAINGLYNRLLHPTTKKVDALGNPTLVPSTAQAVIEQAQAGGADPDYIAVAQSLLDNGGKLDKKGVDAAHRIGLHVNGRWKIATASSATPKQSVGGVAGVVAGAVK